jgi:hypothetical protein
MGVEYAGVTGVNRYEGAGVTVVNSTADFTGANIVIAMMGRYSGTLASITHGGLPFTFHRSQGATSLGSEMWYLVNPLSGSQALQSLWSSGTGLMVIVFAGYSGVNTGAPIRVTESSGNNGQSSLSDTITGNGVDLLVTGTAHRGVNDSTAPTNGVTERVEYQSAAGGGRLAAIGDKSATGGVDTVGWTYNAPDNNTIIVVSLKPAVGGNQVMIFASKIQKFYDELRRGLIPPHRLRERYQEVYAI